MAAKMFLTTSSMRTDDKDLISYLLKGFGVTWVVFDFTNGLFNDTQGNDIERIKPFDSTNPDLWHQSLSAIEPCDTF